MKKEALKKLIKHIIRESMTPYDVNVDDPGDFVLGDLTKLFKSGKRFVSWKEIQNVGLLHIKDADKAMKHAQRTALKIADDEGYEVNKNGINTAVSGPVVKPGTGGTPLYKRNSVF